MTTHGSWTQIHPKPINSLLLAAPVIRQNQIDDLVKFARDVGDDAKRWRDEKIAQAKAENGGTLPKHFRLPHQMKSEISPLDGTRRPSPVTEKDIDLGQKIMDKLKEISPNTPIICEEEPHNGYNIDQRNHIQASTRLDGSRGPTYWVVDPIDGTSNFINPDKKHYGVLIGLIENGKPTFGITYYPEYDILNYTKGTRAYTQHQGKTSEIKITPPFTPTSSESLNITGNVQIALNKPHHEGLDSFRAALSDRAITTHCTTSSHARADLNYDDYPDEIPIMQGVAQLGSFNNGGYEWDYAARQAIFKAAGGEFIGKVTGRPPVYGASDTFYLRPAWTGHIDTLTSTGLAHPSAKLGITSSGRGSA